MTNDMNAEAAAGQDEIADIQETIRTDPAAYHGDSAMRERLETLVTARDAGEAPPPMETDTPEAEIKKIQDVIRTDPGRYWSDKGMQARMEQLSLGPEPAPENFLGLRDYQYAKADIMGDERLVDVFKGQKGERDAETYYERAADLFTAEDITGPLEAMEIRDSFTGLDVEMSPGLARWIVGMDKADMTMNVDVDAAREPFLSTEEGQILQGIWGGDFDRNLSKYLGRVEALKATVPAAVFDRFLDKFEALSPSAARAVIEWIVRT